MKRAADKSAVPALVLALSVFAACDATGPDFDDGSLERIPDLGALPWADVRPARAWDYWELRHAFPGSGSADDIVGSGGPVARSELPPAVIAALDETQPIRGFAPSCLPAYCFDFIAAVAGTEITIFTTSAGLRDFLGDLESLTEAALLVHGLGFYWLTSEPGTGFREIGDSDWEFVVLELVKTCAPVQTDRVLLRVESDGPVEELRRTIWQRHEGVCI